MQALPFFFLAETLSFCGKYFIYCKREMDIYAPDYYHNCCLGNGDGRRKYYDNPDRFIIPIVLTLGIDIVHFGVIFQLAINPF